jgi:hypothetical protein
MLEQTREILSKKLGLELVVTLDSREENCADEVDGHFLQCAPNLGFSSQYFQDWPPTVCIYEGGKVQLWHDATPYPVKANTAAEARDMLRSLVPHPVDHTLLTVDDFNKFIDALKETASAWDED